jgi:hypothetical protein
VHFERAFELYWHSIETDECDALRAVVAQEKLSNAHVYTVAALEH